MFQQIHGNVGFIKMIQMAGLKLTEQLLQFSNHNYYNFMDVLKDNNCIGVNHHDEKHLQINVHYSFTLIHVRNKMFYSY